MRVLKPTLLKRNTIIGTFEEIKAISEIFDSPYGKEDFLTLEKAHNRGINRASLRVYFYVPSKK